MIARLLEAHYVEHSANPTEDQIRFWLREMRTAGYLTEVVREYPSLAREIVETRPLLEALLANDSPRLETTLMDEERAGPRLLATAPGRIRTNEAHLPE
jgi:hypothetical protein